MEKLGAGEIIINSIDRDGTWSGFDVDLIKLISENVTIPVIACGGAGNLSHIEEVAKKRESFCYRNRQYGRFSSKRYGHFN